MIVRVSPFDVRYRCPYFIECVICKTAIYGHTPDEVAEKAQKEGWRYLTKRDAFICKECFEWLKDDLIKEENTDE